jgi:serine/threonine-protein kinase RsbT
MEDEVRVPITTDADLVTARAEGRAMAERLGFPRPDPTLIATAISEVARNIVVHVGRGEIVLKPFEDAGRYGLVVIARDDGPGIRDVEAAVRDDYSARGGLGLGLPGARRLMDERRQRHDRDDDEVEVPRRACEPPRGASSACVIEQRANRSSGALP